MTCCSPTDAPNKAPKTPAPIAQPSAPHVADARQHATARPRSEQGADRFAQSLSVPQYGRTFVQGCACSTGFAGGGCCPGGASSLALQSGCGAHGVMGVTSGLFGALGIYGGMQVIANSTDAAQQIRLVQQHVGPQVDRLALLEAEASAAQLPHGRIGHRLQALRVWARSLDRAASEQRFNFWVPGVVQSLAAASAMGVAAEHVGLIAASPVIGAWMGIVAPALFATYGLMLCGKHTALLWRAPHALTAAQQAQSPERRSYLRAAQSYAQMRHTTGVRTALAWGLVGAVGVAGAVVSAGVCALPMGAWAWFGLSLGAAGFAMWQNSHTRFVPHLPISPHVEPTSIGTLEQRQHTATVLQEQDKAIKTVTQTLFHNAVWPVRIAHALEQAFSPQCGPRANQVAAQVMQRACHASDRRVAGRYTHRVIEACISWCAQEIKLVQARAQAATASIREDDAALQQRLAPSCKHKSARVAQALEAQGAFVHTLERIHACAQQDAASVDALHLRRHILEDVHSRLHDVRDADMADVIGHDAHIDRKGPAQTWLWARLELLLLSGTLADAIDQDFIKRHPSLFSQVATPDALPIHNVYVLPSQIDAFAQAIATRIDGAFVHAFCNPRRIEAEIDFLFELEYAAQMPPQADVGAPVCTGETCCR